MKPTPVVRTILCVFFFAALAVGQCALRQSRAFNANPSSQMDTGLRRSFVFTNPESFPIRLCSVEVKMSRGSCSGATMRIEIRGGASAPGSNLIARGESQPILATDGGHTQRFCDVVIPAGGRRHIVLHYEGTNGCGWPTQYVLLPGTDSSSRPITESYSYRSQSGLSFWLRDDKRIRYRVQYEDASAASSTIYGSSCDAAVACSSTPVAINWSPGQLVNSTFSQSRAFRLDAPVVADEYYCAIDLPVRSSSSTASRTVEVSILSDCGDLPGTALATTTVTVAPGVSSVQAVFPSPVRIPAATWPWIGVRPLDGAVQAPAAANGTKLLTAGGSGSAWTSRGEELAWSVRLYSPVTPPNPVRMDGTLPVLGSSFDSRLHDAPGNAFAILSMGFSNPMLDLANYGAPGCRALTSGELSVSAVTDPSGLATITLALPADPAFLGAPIHQQFAVLSAVNALGIVFTNGILATTGV
ncbi:MAG: hypothetical protein NXI31_20740 [bacterium]|nr:hypothetical protein [bacterium]